MEMANFRGKIHTFPMLRYAILFSLGIIAGRYIDALSVREWSIFLALIALAALFSYRRDSFLCDCLLMVSLVLMGSVRYSFSLIGSHEGEKEAEITLWERGKQFSIETKEAIIGELKETGMAEEPFAVASAMTFGYKEELTKELRNDYSLAGASHILALSGMHLSIIFLMLTVLFRWRSVVTSVIILTIIWTYVFITGMPPSLLRAATMLTIWEILRKMGRFQNPLNVLGVTMLLLLAIEPEMLWNISFQLSFLAVAAILIYAKEIEEMVESPGEDLCFENKRKHWTRKSLERVWQLTSVSIAAQIGTMPVAAYYFGTIPIMFFITNLVVIPLSAVIICGTVLLLLTTLLPWALPSSVVAWVMSWIIDMQNNFLHFFSSLPFTSISGVHINLVQLYLIYIIIIAATVVYVRVKR